MGDLGDLTPNVSHLDDTFGWFGKQYRVGPSATSLALADFLDQASNVDPDRDPVEAMSITVNMLRRIVHPDDYPAFWAVCMANSVDIPDLMRLINLIVEKKTGRPTKRRSDSSPGRRNTAAKSGAGSRSHGVRAASRGAIERLQRQGRADLAMAIVQADRARAQMAAGSRR